jgi:hypothetical protein
MDATRTRTGDAPSLDRRYDRTVTDRRLRALTIAAAIAGASGVAGFGFLAAQGSTPAAAQAVLVTDAAGTTVSTSAGATTAPATAAPVLQAAPGGVAAGGTSGQVTTGGS